MEPGLSGREARIIALTPARGPGTRGPPGSKPVNAPIVAPLSRRGQERPRVRTPPDELDTPSGAGSLGSRRCGRRPAGADRGNLLGGDGHHAGVRVDGDAEEPEEVPPEEPVRPFQVGVVDEDQQWPRHGIAHGERVDPGDGG